MWPACYGEIQYFLFLEWCGLLVWNTSLVEILNTSLVDMWISFLFSSIYLYRSGPFIRLSRWFAGGIPTHCFSFIPPFLCHTPSIPLSTSFLNPENRKRRGRSACHWNWHITWRAWAAPVPIKCCQVTIAFFPSFSVLLRGFFFLGSKMMQCFYLFFSSSFCQSVIGRSLLQPY